MKISYFIIFLSCVLTYNAFAEDLKLKENLNSTVAVGKASLNKIAMETRFECFRKFAMTSPHPTAEMKESRFEIIGSTGMMYSGFNSVMEKDNDRSPSEKEIASAKEFFFAKKLPFGWWTASKNLEDHGFILEGVCTGVARDISEMPQMPIMQAALKITIVNTFADLITFTAIASKNFTLNEQVEKEWLQFFAATMNPDEQIHFLALWDGVPVGTVTLTTFGPGAAIWNLTTLPKYRKRGIGTALVYAAIFEAKKKKFNQIMAIVSPEKLSLGIFKKFGFQEFGKFPYYLY